MHVGFDTRLEQQLKKFSSSKSRIDYAFDLLDIYLEDGSLNERLDASEATRREVIDLILDLEARIAELSLALRKANLWT